MREKVYDKMKKTFENKKGITLIALVVTIVVLIILAGISITMLFGNEGIIEKSKEASFKTRFRSVEEAVQLYVVDKESEEISLGQVLYE